MLRFAPAQTIHEPRPGGGCTLRCPIPLPAIPASVTAKLQYWSEHEPRRVYLAEGPREVSYRTAWNHVRALSQVLLGLELGPTRPLAILAENGIEHALLTLAGLHVGIPVAPISVAYALATHDHDKLRAVIATIAPGALFVADKVRYAAALRSLDWKGPLLDAHEVRHLAHSTITPDVEDLASQVKPDTVGKILFTSGSTGAPRGLCNTHRNLASNQEAMTATWPFLNELVPRVVDWLPWSHTFGGNHNFFLVLWHGGTLVISDGKPMPGAFDRTADLLRKTKPNLYFDVPRGFDLLVDRFEVDDAFAREVLENLQLIFYAAAALSSSTWERLERVVARHKSAPLAFVSAWGATETTPLATQVHFPIARAGVIGLPIAGTELALVPHDDKLELCVRGPNVSPGAWQPGGRIEPLELDAEGFWHSGDAVRLEDEAAPERGVVFDGRLKENFKLASGTWVSVGNVRLALLSACAPLLADAVITGEGRGEIGALVFPTPGVVLDAAYTELLADKLPAEGSSSTLVRRVSIMREPPSLAAGEITDKGYLNQRAVLERRKEQVEQLYASPRPVLLP